MPEDKSLKFVFDVDQASLQKTKQLIRELTSDLAKLNEAVKGSGGIGGLGGGGGINITNGPRSAESQRVVAKTAPAGKQLVQGFLDQKQIFKGIADGSKDSMRVMNESLKQAINFQKREIESLDKTAQDLVKTYDELGRKAQMWSGKPAMSAAIGNQQAAVGAQHTQVVAQQQTAQGNLATLQGMGPGGAPPTPPTPGTGGSGFFSMGRFGKGWKGALGLVGAAAAVANFGLDESLAGSRAFNTFGARRSEAAGGMFNRIMSGDVKDIFAMRMMDQSQRRDLRAQVTGFSADAEQVRGGIGHALANAPLVGPVARALGIGDAAVGGGMMGGFVGANQETGKAENSVKQIEAATKALSPMMKFSMDQFSSQLMQRVGVGRILGTGLSKDKMGNWGDSFGQLDARMQAQGYSAAEYAGSFASMRGLAGAAFGRQMGYTNMSASAAGYSGFGEMAAAGARAGAGTRLGFGAIGGRIDKSAGIQLGSAIIGSGFDPMGTTSGLGTLAAAQQGMGFDGSVMDFRRVQQVQAGLGLGSQLTQGTLDPYQGARNLVGAIGLHSGSTYSQDFLANGMNMRQMMDMSAGGELTATARALGLSRGGIKAQLGDSVSSVMDRWVDEGGSDPMSKSLRALQESGLGVSEYLGGLKGKARKSAVENLGAFYGIQTGAGEEAGLGLIGLQAGMSKADIKKLQTGTIGGGVGEVEKTALEAMGKKASMVATELEGIASRLQESWKVSPEKLKTLNSFASDMSASSEAFIKALAGLTNEITAQTKRMANGRGGSYDPVFITAPSHGFE